MLYCLYVISSHGPEQQGTLTRDEKKGKAKRKNIVYLF